MAKITVIVSDSKSETVETSFLTVSDTKGYANYMKRAVFQVKSKWPACLRADPQRAIADQWEIVISTDDELISGTISKYNNTTIFIDTRF